MSEKLYHIKINGALVEVPKQLYLEYYRSKRRDKYYEHDIKIENAVRDKNGNIVGYRPSREDSLERLLEAGGDYRDDSESVEDTAILKLTAAALHEALRLLPDDERDFIETLFFSNGGSGMSEREYARILGLSKTAIHARKEKVLRKLKKLLGS